MVEDELKNVKFDFSLFWKLENASNLDVAEAVESNSRFDAFEDVITRLPDGRYCTPFPWTTVKWSLKTNLQLVTGRLKSTLVRLRRSWYFSTQDLVDYEKEIHQQMIDNQFVEVADMEYDGHHMFLSEEIKIQ